VNGTIVTSGSASGAIPLNVGPNTITVLVTAQDGTTTQSYTITVTRAAVTQYVVQLPLVVIPYRIMLPIVVIP
jgi:small neutral amino acid transporter SnatA (MarC family)